MKVQGETIPLPLGSGALGKVVEYAKFHGKPRIEDNEEVWDCPHDKGKAFAESLARKMEIAPLFELTIGPCSTSPSQRGYIYLPVFSCMHVCGVTGGVFLNVYECICSVCKCGTVCMCGA